jgi:hypothetical protein
VSRRALAAAVIAVVLLGGVVVVPAVLAALGLSGGDGDPGPAHIAASSIPTVYVDGGSVGGPCSDARRTKAARKPATPVCTIDRGLQIVPTGGRVLVRRGTYPPLRVTQSGSSYVTVAAAPGETVSLPNIAVGPQASWLRFSGLTLTGAGTTPSFALLEGAPHHVQLLRSTVRSDGADAIVLGAGSAHVLIADSHISSRPPGTTGGGDGIAFASTSALPNVPDPSSPHDPITDVTIRNNRFDDIGTDAIRPANFDGLLVEGNDITGVVEAGGHSDALQITWGGRHFVFRDNYIHDNQAQGLFIKDGRVYDATIVNNVFVDEHDAEGFQMTLIDVDGLRVMNNTVWNNVLGVLIGVQVRNGVVRNNIFQELAANDPVEARANVVQDHNIITGGYGYGAGARDSTRPPRFVDARGGDYRLASGSPGVDAADATGAPTRDKACRARYDWPRLRTRGTGRPPYGDLGALERRPDSRPTDVRATGCR